MRRLGRDTTGSERLMGSFILIASFLIITVMVLTSMTAFLQIASGNWEEVTGTLLIGGEDYTLRNPEDGWNITNDNVTDKWDHERSENAYFYKTTPGEDDQMVVGFIRDNAYFGATYGGRTSDEALYEDFIMIYTEFGWWDHDDWPISYETIEANQVGDSNVSLTEFGIRHNTTYALIITVDAPGELFAAGLWANAFNVKLGVPEGTDDLAGASMWTVLGQVMTASIPDVTPEVNIILGATVYAGIGMIVFTVISRMIPFVGGG